MSRRCLLLAVTDKMNSRNSRIISPPLMLMRAMITRILYPFIFIIICKIKNGIKKPGVNLLVFSLASLDHSASAPVLPTICYTNGVRASRGGRSFSRGYRAKARLLRRGPLRASLLSHFAANHSASAPDLPPFIPRMGLGLRMEGALRAARACLLIHWHLWCCHWWFFFWDVCYCGFCC